MTPKYIKIAHESTLRDFNLCKSIILKKEPGVKNLTDEQAIKRICAFFILGGG
jgi:hypothetical protein